MRVGNNSVLTILVADTVRVVLTDECKLRSVTADAVKIVKR